MVLNILHLLVSLLFLHVCFVYLCSCLCMYCFMKKHFNKLNYVCDAYSIFFFFSRLLLVHLFASELIYKPPFLWFRFSPTIGKGSSCGSISHGTLSVVLLSYFIVYCWFKADSFIFCCTFKGLGEIPRSLSDRDGEVLPCVRST